MPFGIAQSLPKWPSVRILFHGLLLWYPDKDGKSCRIGVLRGAPDHYLSIEVRIKKQGDPDFPIMRYFAPMRFSHNDDDTSPGLLITTVNKSLTGIQGCKYVPLRINCKTHLQPNSSAIFSDNAWQPCFTSSFVRLSL